MRHFRRLAALLLALTLTLSLAAPAASGVVTPRAASTEASSQEYPAERRVSTALRSASPMFHFLYFTRVPLPIGEEESKARFHPRF